MVLNATHAFRVHQTKSGMVLNAILAILVHLINCVVGANVILAVLARLIKCELAVNVIHVALVRQIKCVEAIPQAVLLALFQALVQKVWGFLTIAMNCKHSGNSGIDVKQKTPILILCTSTKSLSKLRYHVDLG